MNTDDVFSALKARCAQEADMLDRLDAAIGDGDHGTTMLRGLSRAVDAVPGQKARTFMRASGGASGTLFGLLLHEIELHYDKGEPLVAGLGRAAARIRELGEVNRGDKSMIDALSPAVDALWSGGSLTDAAAAAARGRDATRDLSARRGRAQYVEGGGIGNIDPGAASVAWILDVLAAQGETP